MLPSVGQLASCLSSAAGGVLPREAGKVLPRKVLAPMALGGGLRVPAGGEATLDLGFCCGPHLVPGFLLILVGIVAGVLALPVAVPLLDLVVLAVAARVAARLVPETAGGGGLSWAVAAGSARATSRQVLRGDGVCESIGVLQTWGLFGHSV